MHIHLHYFFFFTETVKLFQEIRPIVGKPCPLYILLRLQEGNGLDLGRTGFTLFRRLRRFRRAEIPDEYRMHCTPPKYLLRHRCIRKDHFICCSSLE